MGIFGEGTDAPSLNAVAFLEARKSPIDVIQAVGRAMRTAPGKEMGYIICPIVVPPNVDPEQWLSTSNKEEGWQELGQILLALRSHDQRIEDNLADLLQLYIPKPPPALRTIVAVATVEDKRIHYREHEGPPGEAQEAVERVLEGASTLTTEFRPISELEPTPAATDRLRSTADTVRSAYQTDEPTQIVAGKKNIDGSIELRMDTVVRANPAPDGTRGEVDIRKSKAKAKSMINNGEGVRIPTSKEKKPRPTREERAERSTMQMLLLSGLEDHGNAIKMNLLAKSGLVDNRVVRDLNILESSVKEAAHHMRDDGLQPALDRHFGLDNLKDDKRKSQADGCTIAALLMMNAAMLHQRIANGGWLTGVSDLEEVKNDVNVVRRVRREWDRIMRHDFRPVLEPAVNAIEAVEDTGRLAGLERALRHITAEAERIAETYADMGADHAGPLFNRVMGNQASDGAFFTRPVAASIAARLTVDTCGDVDWTDADVWRDHKTVDLACGSGTLLAAMLTDMKRRARERGANEAQIADLQKLAVEETIKGLDINPVSLQLAASQLTAGNHEIRFRQMGLHLMPYGPHPDDLARVSVGTLELLAQKAIVPRNNELDLADDRIASQSVWPADDVELADAVDAAKNARIVIMNPPFSSRKKMGEKFSQATKTQLQRRVDAMEDLLTGADNQLADFTDRNALEPLFTALADKCTGNDSATLTMINPTAALSAPSATQKRRILAQRYHIHTVLTGRWPREFTLSQNVEIDECMVVAVRYTGQRPPTRFIHLDRMPHDEAGVDELHQALLNCPHGPLADGWGEVSYWPAEHMEKGDWTPAIWRSPELAKAARKFAEHPDMRTIREHGYSCEATLQMMDKKNFIPAEPNVVGTFPIISSKGAHGQTTIRSTPDAEWQPTNRDEEQRILNGGTYPQVDKLLAKAGHLLVTSGQAPSTARVSAIADDNRYVGRGWLPVTGPDPEAAKAVAIFINSTAGRLQLLRNAGRKIAFPQYNPKPIENIRIPNVEDARIRQILAKCWERTSDIQVPQFQDGECQVRRLWDEAVAHAMAWDADELTSLRELLNREPHVRGLGYNQYADELDDDYTPTSVDPESFERLADEWERDRPRGVDIAQMTRHPAYQRIIAMGEPAVPWLLHRLATKPDHWFVALSAITGAKPVAPESRGRIKEMVQAWLDWGSQQGYELKTTNVD